MKNKQFTIKNSDDLALYNRKMEFVVEPGKFNVYVGSSSEDIRLNGTFELVNKHEADD